MSKQSEAKKAQGYIDKPVPSTCGNCLYYTSDFIRKDSRYGGWTEEKNRRCMRGAFVVRKTATCDLWKLNQRATQHGPVA